MNEQAPRAVVMRPLNHLVVSETNARFTGQKEDLNPVLVASIKESGILHPILVKQQVDGTFDVIDGSRRLAAAKKLKLTEVPTLEVDGDGMTSIAMNVSVQALSCFDKYDAYRRLIAEGVTDAQIKKALGFGTDDQKVVRAIGQFTAQEIVKLRKAAVTPATILKLARIPTEHRKAVLDACERESGGLTDNGLAHHARNYWHRDINPARFEAIKDAYITLGGKVSEPLFDLGDGLKATPVDGHMIEPAIEAFLKEKADERTKLTGRPTRFTAGVYVHSYTADNGIVRADNVPEVDDVVIADAGFATMEEYEEFHDRCEAEAEISAEDEERYQKIEIGLIKRWPAGCFEIATLSYSGELVFHGPYRERAGGQSADSDPDDETGETKPVIAPDEDAAGLSGAATRRRDAIFAQMLGAAIATDHKFGLAVAAFELYRLARSFIVGEAARPKVSVLTAHYEQDSIADYVNDSNRKILFRGEFEKPLTMTDFIASSEKALKTSICVSVACLVSRQNCHKELGELLALSGKLPRDLYDSIAEPAHVANWLGGLTKPALQEFVDKLDPEAKSIARMVKDMKKADAISLIGRALDGTATGHPDDVRTAAAGMMPPGLGIE